MAPRKPAKREPAKPGPKPKTLSYEQEVQLEALASVLTVEQIADHFGMARSTLFKIMADDPDIRDIAWFIEELRVSLWAQQLGTARAVSEQRILKAINAAR